MRKRSQTIQADTYEEYLELSIAQAPDMTGNTSLIPHSPYCEPLYPPKEIHNFTQKFCDIYTDCQYDPVSQLNITSQCCDLDNQIEYDGTKTPSTENTEGGSRTLSAAGSASECENWSPCFYPDSLSVPKMEKTKVHKVMSIGQTGVGRHYLLDSVFGADARGEAKLKQPFDLVIKHQKQDGCSNTFKFWLRDPSDEKIEPLIKVYYKSISLYIFLYRLDDRQSFECLDRAIEQVKREVPEERFRGLLIANGRPFDRMVFYGEGLKLKEKHKLAQFIEMHHHSSTLEKVLLEFICPKDKKEGV